MEATPDEVYEVWLDKTSPGSPWFGVPRVILDKPKVDSLFYSAYRIEEKEIAHYGRFLNLDPGRLIQYTWVSAATHGTETILTVSLKAVDGRTEVMVHHALVPDDDEGHRHKVAWGFVLTRMGSHFKREE